MNGFVCCACEYRFPEAAALQTQVTGGFIEFCCPYCGSDDIEDAQNLEQIQASKAKARESLGRFRSEFDALVSTGDEAYRRDMVDAGRGHLVRS
jgi:transcription initiation factor IIE alpha subunit